MTRLGLTATLILTLGFGSTAIACSAGGITPLIRAAKRGDLSAAKSLLDKGGDPNATNAYGWTALMYAAREGHTDVVKFLLEAGANPNIESKRITGNTQAPYPASNALREAIGGDHAKLAILLLDEGAVVDPTAFAMAGGCGDIPLLEKMVAKGADPNVPSPGPYRYYPSALVVASSKGKFEAVKWLVGHGAKVDLKAMDSAALRAAVNGDHPEIVEFLLSNGADPNLPTSLDKATPLLHAINCHVRSAKYDPELKIVEALLAKGGKPDYASPESPYRKRNALEFILAARSKAAERAKPDEKRLAKFDAVIARLRK